MIIDNNTIEFMKKYGAIPDETVYKYITIVRDDESKTAVYLNVDHIIKIYDKPEGYTFIMVTDSTYDVPKTEEMQRVVEYLLNLKI